MKTGIRNLSVFRIFFALAASFVVATSTVQAAAYMKLGDIKGESTDSNHKEWINIESMSSPIFRAMVTDSATGYARRRGDVILEDITCTKELDKSSPKIAATVANGTHFDEVWIVFTRSITSTDATGGKEEAPYLTYKIKDVIVTSYNFHGTSTAGDPEPVESITLGYTEVEWTYIVRDRETGAALETITSSWASPHTDP